MTIDIERLDEVIEEARKHSKQVFDVRVVTIAMLEDIIDAIKEKEKKQTKPTAPARIDFRKRTGCGLSEKDIKYRRRWEFDGLELGLLLDEISVQLSDGYYEGSNPELYPEFWHWFEFRAETDTCISPVAPIEKSYIYFCKPSKYIECADTLGNSSDVKILEYIYGVAKWVVDDLSEMDADNEFEKKALTTLADRIIELKTETFKKDLRKEYELDA